MSDPKFIKEAALERMRLRVIKIKLQVKTIAQGLFWHQSNPGCHTLR